MRETHLLSVLFCFALLLSSGGCELKKTAVTPGPESIILSVNKTVYAPEDTVQVTLYNGSSEPVFLEGCSPLWLATRTDSGWVEGPLVVCIWEGLARKINPGETYQETYPARSFWAVHKFVAPIYFGCVDGKPISQAQCVRQDKIYSSQFVIIGYENAAGNLTIRTQKTQYTWGPESLGSSPRIQATLTNNSEQTYYAKLGDRFNSSIDQDDLFVAEGSGGFIEKFNPDGSWSAMPRGILIEGTRFIALRPGKSYQLFAFLHRWRKDETGLFRIKVEYFTQLNPPEGTQVMVDYSLVFRIR